MLKGVVEKLSGERVELRPFRPGELDAWIEARRRLGIPAQPQGPPTREDLSARIHGSGKLVAGRLDLAIEADGRLVGQIQTYRPPERRLPPSVAEIGIALFDDGDRGRGLGSEAVALLAEWLVREAGARRVQAATQSSNAAMRRVLEKAGFAATGTVEVGGEPYELWALERRPA